MSIYCFLSRLTSIEWAAWIQAIGVVLAIFSGWKISISQLRKQHQIAQIEITKNLSVLAENSLKAMKYVSEKINSRESIYFIAKNSTPIGLSETQQIHIYLGSVPIHVIPSFLITDFMLLESTIRQFNEKVEMVFRTHESMDAQAYQDFFNLIKEMDTRISETFNKIKNQLAKLENLL